MKQQLFAAGVPNSSTNNFFKCPLKSQDSQSDLYTDNVNKKYVTLSKTSDFKHFHDRAVSKKEY